MILSVLKRSELTGWSEHDIWLQNSKAEYYNGMEGETVQLRCVLTLFRKLYFRAGLRSQQIESKA